MLVSKVFHNKPLITKTNDYTSNKSFRVDIKWKFYKRT